MRRQRECEAGAVLDRVVELEVAAHFAREAAAEGEPQPDAGGGVRRVAG